MYTINIKPLPQDKNIKRVREYIKNKMEGHIRRMNMTDKALHGKYWICATISYSNHYTGDAGEYIVAYRSDDILEFEAQELADDIKRSNTHIDNPVVVKMEVTIDHPRRV